MISDIIFEYFSQLESRKISWNYKTKINFIKDIMSYSKWEDPCYEPEFFNKLVNCILEDRLIDIDYTRFCLDCPKEMLKDELKKDWEHRPALWMVEWELVKHKKIMSNTSSWKYCLNREIMGGLCIMVKYDLATVEHLMKGRRNKWNSPMSCDEWYEDEGSPNYHCFLANGIVHMILIN